LKSTLKIILRMSITVALFFYLFYYMIDLDKLLETIEQADPLYLAAAFCFLVITILISTWRWKLLLDLKNLKVPYHILLKEYLVGNYFNNFLPTSIGGDVVRFLNIAAYTGKKSMVLASVIIDRVIGFIALILIANTGVFFLKAGNNHALTLLSFLFSAFFMAIFVMLISRRLNRKVSRLLVKFIPGKLKHKVIEFFASFNTYSEQRYSLVKNLLISLMYRICEGLFVYMIVLSLHIKISYLYTLVLHSVVSVLKLAPSINGLGVSEFSWVNLSDTTLISPEKAVTLSLLIYFTSLILSLPGGILNMLNRKNHIKSPE